MTQWRGDDEFKRRMAQYARDAKQAVVSLADRWKPEIVIYAKENAPWTDQTANARQSLYAYVESADGKVIIWLSHGMPYGVWLELRNQGRYAIIMQSLEAHYQPIMDSYRRLFR